MFRSLGTSASFNFRYCVVYMFLFRKVGISDIYITLETTGQSCLKVIVGLTCVIHASVRTRSTEHYGKNLSSLCGSIEIARQMESNSGTTLTTTGKNG
jgi:hypothetical protein